MIQPLTIHDFYKNSKGNLTLDVRSEGEYTYGHIPHATNLPLFNNEERKMVGTAYKQQGKQEAILLGLDIVGKKMADFIRFVQQQSKSKKVFVHCWRGGMRSEGMAWLLNLYGYEVAVLKGGYKSYRHHVLDTLAKQFQFIVLGGRTGSGKTKILKELQNVEEQVIDLEALANHKGSAFGALGQPAQPSTEYFENLLAEELSKMDNTKPVWLEDESRTIGKVFLDWNLWEHMSASPLFVVELPMENRIESLIKEYGSFSTDFLEQSLTNIKKRLGNEQWKNAVQALHANDIEQVTKIAIRYYDKAYDKAITTKDKQQVFHFAFQDNDITVVAAALQKEARKKYGY